MPQDLQVVLVCLYQGSISAVGILPTVGIGTPGCPGALRLSFPQDTLLGDAKFVWVGVNYGSDLPP